MNWTNFHGHTDYCDGKGKAEDYILKAIDLGMPAIGISSHSPVPFESSWNMPASKLPNYLNEIKDLKKKYKEQIQIYVGMEIDFIPGIAGPSHFSELDYCIGSVHYIDALPDGKPWEIDGPHTVFKEGLFKIFNNDIQRAVTRYYDLTRQLVLEEKPVILGHLDKIKIQNEEGVLFSESDKWYIEQIEATLAVVKSQGIIVEVNTRGLYKKKSKEPYPSYWILKKILALGIPILISSDAHHPDELIKNFDSVTGELMKIGFKKLMIMYDSQWQEAEFDKNGLSSRFPG